MQTENPNLEDYIDPAKFPNLAKRLNAPLKQGNHARNFAGPKVVCAETTKKWVGKCDRCNQDIWQ